RPWMTELQTASSGRETHELRRSDSWNTRVSAQPRGVVAEVAAALEAEGYPEKDIFSIRLALEEAIVNAVKHGHQDDPSLLVRVSFRVTAGEVLLEVEDQGPGFDPEQVPDPTAPENLERCGGRGLFLMRHYMTWIHYNARGNCVTLCKARSRQTGASRRGNVLL